MNPTTSPRPSQRQPQRHRAKRTKRTKKTQAASSSFKVGKVHVYLRGQVWYIRYYERGRRILRRVGP